MLVISRRKGQRITIGDDVEIVVTAVHKNGVKLGIVAPRGLSVLRGEVRDAIFSANMEATKSTVDQAAAIVSAVPPVRQNPHQPAARLGLRRQPPDASASQSGDGPPAEGPKAEERVVRRSVHPSTPPVPIAPTKPEAP